MNSLNFVVYGPPQGKGRPRISKFSGVFTPQKTVSYESAVVFAAGNAMNGRPLYEKPVYVKIRALFEIPSSYSKKKRTAALMGHLYPAKKPDIDNIQKAVLDGCNKVVWKDDALICKIEVEKAYSDKPRVEVHVRELEDGEI